MTLTELLKETNWKISILNNLLQAVIGGLGHLMEETKPMFLENKFWIYYYLDF